MKTWLDFRDRLLTSPKFQEWALAFPLTRPIVRKRQNELFDIVSGFVYSQILDAVVQLNVLKHVSGQGRSIDDLARLCSLGEDEMRRLAEGAASLRLLQRHGDRYRLGDLGAALSGNAGALAMIRHHGALYRDITDLPALLRGGRQETNLSRYWDYARSDDPALADADDVAPYSELMAQSQRMVAAEVVASFNFSPYRKLLDFGGGQGAFVSAVADAAPDLQLAVFDLPAVAERATRAFEAQGISGRATAIGGSFFGTPPKRAADLVSLVRILHDHDDESVTRILAAAFEAVEPGGKLIVCEPMSTDGGARRIADAYFNIYLYAMGSGRPRSPEMLTEMLKTAGFSAVQRVKTRSPFVTSMLCAHKSAEDV
ncbi:methyltransferase [Ahrensia sp. R2A130]|uniref:methyltransferase n=1 Tax=Ahrensia sp. R2A130 TaxID=744979 RepID=UPI0001E0840F|nr:methyltransferase [Ahrensia sp. R2A130]EFL89069.1 hydroxyneurosporene methyltransferase [Ahrensia sp. R2A130]